MCLPSVDFLQCPGAPRKVRLIERQRGVMMAQPAHGYLHGMTPRAGFIFVTPPSSPVNTRCPGAPEKA